MKYSSKKLPNSIVETEVTLSHKEFLEYYQPIYEQAISQVHLKGFRPGTAPKDLADKAVDKEKIFNEAVSKAARDSLKEITEENNWELVDQPQVEVLETNPQADLGLKFKATLTVFPEIKLGNYQKISKKFLAERKEVKTDEEEIEKTVKWVLDSRAKDGKTPELTDDFVKSVGRFENVAEFKNSIREGIKKEKEFKETERLRLKIMEEIIKNSTIEIPQIMVEKTMENMLVEYRSLVKKENGDPEIKKKMEERARNSVAGNLVLYEISKREKLDPTPEEVEKEAGKFHQTGVDPKKLYDYSYSIVQNRKVFEYLESLK